MSVSTTASCGECILGEHQAFYFTVSALVSYTRKGELFGKRFLVGYTEIDLDTAALFCAVNQV